MNFPVYVKPQERLVAIRITENNLGFVECWCNGDIKGILLPVADRVIHFWSNGTEYEARIGDWIIRLPTERHYIVFDDQCFRANFMVDE